MPKIRVHVIESGGDFFVQPGIVSAEKNDSFRIINRTNEDLVFYIKDASVLKNASDQTKVVDATKKVAIDLSNNAADGSYEYQILMVQSGKKAKGNSDPVLIIDN